MDMLTADNFGEVYAEDDSDRRRLFEVSFLDLPAHRRLSSLAAKIHFKVAVSLGASNFTGADRKWHTSGIPSARTVQAF